jgi:hypothetical protein
MRVTSRLVRGRGLNVVQYGEGHLADGAGLTQCTVSISNSGAISS